MKTRYAFLIMSSLIATTALSVPAFAQDASDPGHPRISEVDQRLQNQQNRINTDVSNGTMTTGQAARDEKRDARVQKQMTADEAKHGGHITKAEQKHLNKELNKNSRAIHRQHKKGEKAKAAPAQ